MPEEIFYWAENLEDYSSNNDTTSKYDEVIQIKRLNFFIGKNNSGKSRFLRELFKTTSGQQLYNSVQYRKLMALKRDLISELKNGNKNYYNDFLQTVRQMTPTNLNSFETLFNESLKNLSTCGQLNRLYPDNNISVASSKFNK